MDPTGPHRPRGYPSGDSSQDPYKGTLPPSFSSLGPPSASSGRRRESHNLKSTDSLSGRFCSSSSSTPSSGQRPECLPCSISSSPSPRPYVNQSPSRPTNSTFSPQRRDHRQSPKHRKANGGSIDSYPNPSPNMYPPPRDTLSSPEYCTSAAQNRLFNHRFSDPSVNPRQSRADYSSFEPNRSRSRRQSTSSTATSSSTFRREARQQIDEIRGIAIDSELRQRAEQARAKMPEGDIDRSNSSASSYRRPHNRSNWEDWDVPRRQTPSGGQIQGSLSNSPAMTPIQGAKPPQNPYSLPHRIPFDPLQRRMDLEDQTIRQQTGNHNAPQHHPESSFDATGRHPPGGPERGEYPGMNNPNAWSNPNHVRFQDYYRHQNPPPRAESESIPDSPQSSIPGQYPYPRYYPGPHDLNSRPFINPIPNAFSNQNHYYPPNHFRNRPRDFHQDPLANPFNPHRQQPFVSSTPSSEFDQSLRPPRNDLPFPVQNPLFKPHQRLPQHIHTNHHPGTGPRPFWVPGPENISVDPRIPNRPVNDPSIAYNPALNPLLDRNRPGIPPHVPNNGNIPPHNQSRLGPDPSHRDQNRPNDPSHHDTPRNPPPQPLFQVPPQTHPRQNHSPELHQRPQPQQQPVPPQQQTPENIAPSERSDVDKNPPIPTGSLSPEPNTKASTPDAPPTIPVRLQPEMDPKQPERPGHRRKRTRLPEKTPGSPSDSGSSDSGSLTTSTNPSRSISDLSGLSDTEFGSRIKQTRAYNKPKAERNTKRDMATNADRRTRSDKRTRNSPSPVLPSRSKSPSSASNASFDDPLEALEDLKTGINGLTRVARFYENVKNMTTGELLARLIGKTKKVKRRAPSEDSYSTSSKSPREEANNTSSMSGTPAVQPYQPQPVQQTILNPDPDLPAPQPVPQPAPHPVYQPTPQSPPQPNPRPIPQPAPTRKETKKPRRKHKNPRQKHAPTMSPQPPDFSWIENIPKGNWPAFCYTAYNMLRSGLALAAQDRDRSECYRCRRLGMDCDEHRRRKEKEKKALKECARREREEQRGREEERNARRKAKERFEILERKRRKREEAEREERRLREAKEREKRERWKRRS